ncbi:CdaR family protein [Rufibacter immobilis]|uniref:CdaR family protein n=1 Tax=Rufibacter immobilis TaxID=1348778 RepID=UPI0035E62FF4
MPFNKTKHALLWLLRPFSPKQKQYWRVVLLCFFTAATFWLLNALNKSYTAQVSYPIRFKYDPQALVPVKPLPEVVMISVTGKGWKLLRKNLLFNVKPAELSIRGLPHVKRLPGHALRPAIANVLDGLALNFVVTDTVSFDFDRLLTCKFPLAIDTTQVTAAPGFQFVGPVKVRPDSVTFTGPEQILNQFPNPFLLSVPNRSLKAPFKAEVPLVYDYTSLVQADVSEAEVEFSVVALERREVVVQPTLQNFPAGYRLRVMNGPLVVQYACLPKSRELLQPELFQVALDFRQFNAADSTIAPTLLQKAPLTKQISLLPARVKISLIPQ